MASKPKPKLAAVELPDEEPTDVPEAPDEKSRGRGPSDKPKKKKKKKQKGFALSPLALGGIIVGGLSLLLGIVYFAGFGGGKQRICSCQFCVEVRDCRAVFVREAPLRNHPISNGPPKRFVSQGKCLRRNDFRFMLD